MKIEVDIGQIFEDEEGNQVKFDIQDQIIENAKERVVRLMEKRIKDEIDKTLSIILKDKIGEALEKVLPELLDYKFTETTSWGEKKETYTVRDRILKHFEEQSRFKDSGYSHDRNQFTQAVKDVVNQNLTSFKSEFNKKIEAEFVTEAMHYATESLKKRLGLTL